MKYKRILLGTGTFMLFIILLLTAPARSETRITEIMYDLEGNDAGREWIEVYSDEEINLSKWKLFEAGTNHNIKLISGSDTFSGYAIIVDDPAKFIADNPSFSGNLFDSTFSLRNDNETIALKINSSDVVFELTYFSESGGNGNGKSLQYVEGRWCEGSPTPGAANACQEDKQEEAEDNNEEPAANSSNITTVQNETLPRITTIIEQTYKDSEANASKEEPDENKFRNDEINVSLPPVPAKKQVTSKVAANTPESAEKRIVYQSKNETLKQGAIYLLGALIVLLVVYLIRNNKV